MLDPEKWSCQILWHSGAEPITWVDNLALHTSKTSLVGISSKKNTYLGNTLQLGDAF